MRLGGKSAPSGFTVLELLVAPGISVILAMGVGEFLSGMSKSRKYGEFVNTRNMLGWHSPFRTQSRRHR